jgi:hypothetical protein
MKTTKKNKMYIVYNDYCDQSESPILTGKNELDDWVLNEHIDEDASNFSIFELTPSKYSIETQYVVR